MILESPPTAFRPDPVTGLAETIIARSRPRREPRPERGVRDYRRGMPTSEGTAFASSSTKKPTAPGYSDWRYTTPLGLGYGVIAP